MSGVIVEGREVMVWVCGFIEIVVVQEQTDLKKRVQNWKKTFQVAPPEKFDFSSLQKVLEIPNRLVMPSCLKRCRCTRI